MFRHRCSLPIFTLALLAAGFVAQREAAAQTVRDDSLKPYTACQFEDGLQVVQVDRLPKDVTSRTVRTAGGEKKVSLADGYRVLVAYPKTDYFANVKAEKSNPADYEKDKEVILENLKWAIANTKDAEAPEPIKIAYGGFEGYSTSRASLAGATLGIAVLFSDAEHQVLTVYFLNQNPKKRKFQTIEEWRTLRDNFLNRYTSCIKGNSSARP
ncbi:MAG TPA: hypothetical protein VF546_01125 [Pyrinomonadaceae bacterium]